MKISSLTLLCGLFFYNFLAAQDWEQRVDYSMNIDVDHEKFQYDGDMELIYTNNSPDVLDKVFFHVYFNAFQPGSMMDHRLKNIADPDGRMMTTIEEEGETKKISRISILEPEDYGWQKIKSITQNGKPLSFVTDGTILEVPLAQSIQPGEKVKFNMKWKAQIPNQIRRSGKNNKEGIDFSMTQWYPKMAQYDFEGWHLDEYVAREFIAPFGDFDVKITLDKKYIIGASGKLQNPKEVVGYSKNAKPKGNRLTWHFKAENIHDFAWAADPDFVVDQIQNPNGPEIYFVYDKNLDKIDNWKKVQQPTADFFTFMSKTFGEYPWSTYTVVQGGDGGMEYGTITLVTGERSYDSLTGVIFHEAAHSWFQHLFGLNETVDEWMDEGFTSYAEELGFHAVTDKKAGPNKNLGAYKGYYFLAKSGLEEPNALLADYFEHNQAYGIAAYYKGQVYLETLSYIVGRENLHKAFLKFYDDFKFKHPRPNDFKRTVEKVSGINLKWFQNLWVNTTRSVDYGITGVTDSSITIENKSNFAMPLEVFIQYEDNSFERVYIPLRAMRGEKEKEAGEFLETEMNEIYNKAAYRVIPDSFWTNPIIEIPVEKAVSKVSIDITRRLPDVNPEDNDWEKGK